MKNKISIPVIEDVSEQVKAISIGLKKKNLHSAEDAFEKKMGRRNIRRRIS